MKKLAILFILVVFNTCSYNTAFADWTQRFQQSQSEIYEGSNVGPFDKIMVWWKSGEKFAGTGAFSNFLASGWGINNISDIYADVLGPAGSTYTQFDLNFSGLKSTGTEFWAAVLSNGVVKQRQILDFDGKSWTYPGISEADWNSQGGPVVPEPVSSALFLLGGAVLGIKRFRKKAV